MINPKPFFVVAITASGQSHGESCAPHCHSSWFFIMLQQAALAVCGFQALLTLTEYRDCKSVLRIGDLRRKTPKSSAGEAHDAPGGQHASADLFVDGDGGGVPVEDVPLEAWAAFVDGDPGEASEESAANSLPAKGWSDIEVFEADAVVAEPSGVASEIEREACGRRWLVGRFAVVGD